MTHELPPHSIDAEHGVLGSMLISPTDVIPLVNRSLREEDFRGSAERIIWRAINQLHSERIAVDIITLTNTLRATGQLDAIGGPSVPSNLFMFIPTAANVTYYVDIVWEQAKIYRTWRVLSKLIERTLLPATDGVLDTITADLLRLQGDLASHCGEEFPAMPALIQAALDRYEENTTRSGLPAGVHPTGIAKLDAELEGGLFLGDYVIISAITSGGKSALAAGNIALHMACELGSHVAIYSYEMIAAQIIDRMISQRTSIPHAKLRFGKLSESDFIALTRQIETLSNAGIHIRDRIDRWTVDDVANDARAIKAQHGLQLVVVDYLQLVSVRTFGKQREREVAEISRALIGLAKELDVIVVALSQLNDDGMLRESRAIGHDADVVLTIEDAFEESDKRRETPLEEQRVIRINKNRNGQRDKAVRVNWFGSLMKYA